MKYRDNKNLLNSTKKNKQTQKKKINFLNNKKLNSSKFGKASKLNKNKHINRNKHKNKLIKRKKSKKNKIINKLTRLEIKESNENNLFAPNKAGIKPNPWIREKTIEHTSEIKLHFEILDFFDCIKLRADENLIRLKTFQLFKQLLKKEWPNWKMKAFGSFPLEISLPDSDIDVVVFKSIEPDIKNINSYAYDSMLTDYDQLRAIYNWIIKNNFSDESRFVDAKVPIIKLKCRETQIRMDISVNHDHGLKAMKFFKSKLDNYPQMVPIIILLKFVLRQRNLNETFTGGVSSYLLLNLIYAYYQFLSRQRILEKFTNLGKFLIGFLEFYSTFQYEKYGISIRNDGEFFNKSNRNFPYNPNLCFENFQDTQVDIGRGAYLINRIMIIFKDIHTNLRKTTSDSVSYLDTFINVTKKLRKRANFIDRSQHE